MFGVPLNSYCLLKYFYLWCSYFYIQRLIWVNKYIGFSNVLNAIFILDSHIGFREGFHRCVCRSCVMFGRWGRIGRPAGADSEPSTPPVFMFLVNLPFRQAVIVLSFSCDPCDVFCVCCRIICLTEFSKRNR